MSGEQNDSRACCVERFIGCIGTFQTIIVPCRGCEKHFYLVKVAKMGDFVGLAGDERENAQFVGAAVFYFSIASDGLILFRIQ